MKANLHKFKLIVNSQEAVVQILLSMRVDYRIQTLKACLHTSLLTRRKGSGLSDGENVESEILLLPA